MRDRRLLTRQLETHDRASARVGHSPASRLRWLLSFVQSEPAKLPAVALQELVDEMHVFSTNAGYRARDQLWSPSRDDVEAFARRVKDGIENLFGHIESISYGDKWPGKIDHPHAFEITHEDVGEFTEGVTGQPGARQRVPGERRLIRFFIGAGPGPFLKAVLDLVIAHGHRIRKCPLQDCGRLFAATKGQKFHSPNCSARERQAKWAGKLTAKELYDKRHERYEKQVRKIYGNQKIKVRSLGPRKKAELT
jgi:hypothetical protein